jgi:hypothetical protein
MIDLHKERKFVYKLLDRAKMPYPLREEKFQDFAAYFYENYKYDDTYTESTYIGLLFMNWLTLCAIEYKKKYKILNPLTTNTDDKRADYLDWVQSDAQDYKDATQQEISVYCEEVFSKFKPLTQEYLLEKAGGGSLNGSDGRLARGVAKDEGVTRQAIEQRIQKDLKKVLENL